MFSHLWFDLAGTLYKETPEFRFAHDKLRYATYAKLVGEPDPKKARNEYDKLYAKYSSNSAIFRSLGESSDFWMHAFEEMDTAALLKPDLVITQTLARLRDKVPISLFTNFKRHKVLELLEHLEIPVAYFTHVLTGDDITERKPNRAGFDKIIELSNLPAEQILYIGDRIDVDIKPAHRAGLKTCLLYGESGSADYCLNEFGQIEALVK